MGSATEISLMTCSRAVRLMTDLKNQGVSHISKLATMGLGSIQKPRAQESPRYCNIEVAGSNHDTN